MIDTFAIANREHYSGGVRDFQVLGSDKHPTDQWLWLGNFRAEDVNHKQVFRLPAREWVRYLKFRLLSHYGNEYYCTLTYLRVHGSTMLESFREDMEQSQREVASMNEVIKRAASSISSTGAAAGGTATAPAPAPAKQIGGTTAAASASATATGAAAPAATPVVKPKQPRDAVPKPSVANPEPGPPAVPAEPRTAAANATVNNSTVGTATNATQSASSSNSTGSAASPAESAAAASASASTGAANALRDAVDAVGDVVARVAELGGRTKTGADEALARFTKRTVSRAAMVGV